MASDKKFTVSNVNVNKLYLFLVGSSMNGDQTIDIKQNMIYCKSANKAKTNIRYRQMIFDDTTKKSGTIEHLKFFIQNYDMINKVVKHFTNFENIDVVFTYDQEKGTCSKITFQNPFVSYDIFASEFGLSDNYILDSSWANISKPKDPCVHIKINSTKIKEIIGLHSLSKSETEKMNIMTIGSTKDGQVFLKHKSYSNELVFSFNEDSGLVSNNIKGEWKLSLEVFDKTFGYTDFDFYAVTSEGGLKAIYLTNGEDIVNISSLTND